MHTKERLDKRGFLSLEHRTVRVELIKVYKIISSIDKIQTQSLRPRQKMSNVTGHRFNMSGGMFKEICKVSFYTECLECAAKGSSGTR